MDQAPNSYVMLCLFAQCTWCLLVLLSGSDVLLEFVCHVMCHGLLFLWRRHAAFAKYPTRHLQYLLQEKLGDATLEDLVTPIVVPTLEFTRMEALVFEGGDPQ